VTGWVKTLFGATVIGAILGGMWAAYKPAVLVIPPPRHTPSAPRLDDAHAVVVLRRAGAVRRATIACDGDRRTATGFWAGDPLGACSALASTRGALLAGPGCLRIPPRLTSLRVTGAFGQRRFAHQAPFGGCPDDGDWLAVSVFAVPVLGPQRKADDVSPKPDDGTPSTQ
jgi:hypothetical protein